jgi:formylmethanofuran dehydrogenase subunit E
MKPGASRVHIFAHPRHQALYPAGARHRWEAQLTGYQRMPDEWLLVWQSATLAGPLNVLLGRHGQPAVCQVCGEEIINQREVRVEGAVMCRACAAPAYSQLASAPRSQPHALRPANRMVEIGVGRTHQ